MTMAAFSAALEVVANLYDSFLTILLCTLYFGSRFEGWRRNACFAAGVAAFAGVMAWLNSYSVFEGFGGIFYSLVIVLYAWAALEGGIFQKLFFSLFWNCVLMLSGFGVVLFLSLSGLCPPEEVVRYGSPSRALCLVCCMALRAVLARAILCFSHRRRIGRDTGGRREHLIWILYLSGFFLLGTALFGVVFETITGGQNVQFLPILYCGLLALLALIFISFRQADERESRRKEREYLEESLARQDAYICSLSGLKQELQEMNRELQDTMGAVGGLLACGREEDALRRLEQFDGELERFGTFAVYTANDGLNGAVTKAVQDCRRDGVRFTYRIMGSVGRFSSPDLGILLCNLLDNAREGSLKGPGKPSVDLTITNFRGYLKCALENTVNRGLLESNPGFGTDKDDKINHGFGIKSIRRIVELYDGVSKSELICRENGWVLRQELLLGFPRTEGVKTPDQAEKAAGDQEISGV